jgi:hypothetical protein
VSGSVEAGGVLVLRGPAPIVDLISCAIHRHGLDRQFNASLHAARLTE